MIGYEEPLSRPVDMQMERGNFLVLRGANGIGKTTLLKTILGMIPGLEGEAELGDYLEIGYYEQEAGGENRKTCIEDLWDAFPTWNQFEVRSALAKCGLTTKNIESQVRVLSGGEQAKLRLCKIMHRPSNVLFLDEPTNHLDQDAKEALREALREYRGSVLLICHEPEFYQDLMTGEIDCSEWSLRI